ncbi:MAG: hypothetical protein IT481_08675 [Gammaproteobacteria bacterium]|nr:hypothetical protein [Gammaproteobacteria bacterium]
MSEQLLHEIYRAVGRIEGDIASIRAGMDRGSERMDKADRRIAKVENRQHWYSGVAAAIGALLGVGGSHFPKL